MNSAGWNAIRAAAAMLAALLLWSAPAAAQSDPAISEAALRDPWNQQLAVLQSLSGSVMAVEGDARTQLGDALAMLQVALGEFEVQVDRVIDRTLADAQFVYAAGETSQALAAQLAEVHARFDALYAALRVQERADVGAAQTSLETLHQALENKMRFERDVELAFSAGIRQQRVELATRWWNGEERAIAVKKLVADLREKVEGIGDGGGSR
jgi:hypothetical protein